MQIISKIKPIKGPFDRKDILSPAMEKLNLQDKFSELIANFEEEDGKVNKGQDACAFDACIRSSPVNNLPPLKYESSRKTLILNDRLKGKGVFKSTEILSVESERKQEQQTFVITGSSNLWINHLKIHGKLVIPSKDESSIIYPASIGNSGSSRDPSVILPGSTVHPMASIPESSGANGGDGVVNTGGNHPVNISLNDLSFSTAVDRMTKARKRVGTTFEEAQNLNSSTHSLFDNNEDVPLPDYSCSIQKEGNVYRLVEIEDFVTSSKKVYKNVYYILWGTILKEFEQQPLSPDDPPSKVTSLQFANVSVSRDNRNKYIVRLITPSTRIAMQFEGATEAQQWNDHFEMAIAISSSLETREIPKVTRNNSRQRGRPQRIGNPRLN